MASAKQIMNIFQRRFHAGPSADPHSMKDSLLAEDFSATPYMPLPLAGAHNELNRELAQYDCSRAPYLWLQIRSGLWSLDH